MILNKNSTAHEVKPENPAFQLCNSSLWHITPPAVRRVPGLAAPFGTEVKILEHFAVLREECTLPLPFSLAELWQRVPCTLALPKLVTFSPAGQSWQSRSIYTVLTWSVVLCPLAGERTYYITLVTRTCQKDSWIFVLRCWSTKDWPEFGVSGRRLIKISTEDDFPVSLGWLQVLVVSF